MSVPMMGHHSAPPAAMFIAAAMSRQPVSMSAARAARKCLRTDPKMGSKSQGVEARGTMVTRPKRLKQPQRKGLLTHLRCAPCQGSSPASSSAAEMVCTRLRPCSSSDRPCCASSMGSPAPADRAVVAIPMHAEASRRGRSRAATGVSEDARGSSGSKICSARTSAARPTATGQSSMLRSYLSKIICVASFKLPKPFLANVPDRRFP
mmetsp:Transcript_96096/g.310279  ORF Transcript_96096/g.310279 Transcript_96096/m.310279 type:complete len:207 (+) Transcript_96096:899-1519(+)